jgi:dTDP-glucose 4,6-dehydratase
VGSELPVSIRQMAEAFAEVSNPPLGISILNHDISGVAQNHYVPDTEKARLELGLQQYISLDQAIEKTMQWVSGIYAEKEYQVMAHTKNRLLDKCK